MESDFFVWGVCRIARCTRRGDQWSPLHPMHMNIAAPGNDEKLPGTEVPRQLPGQNMKFSNYLFMP